MTLLDFDEPVTFLILALSLTLIFLVISTVVMIKVDKLEKGLAVCATIFTLLLAWFNGVNISYVAEEYDLSRHGLYWYVDLTLGRLITLILFLGVWLSIYYIKMKRNYQDFIRDDSVYIFEDNRLIPIIWVSALGIFSLGSDLTSILQKVISQDKLSNLLITLVPYLLGIVLACCCKRVILHLLARIFLRSGIPEKAVAEGTKKWVPMSEDKLEMIQEYLKKRNILVGVGLAIYIFTPLFVPDFAEDIVKLIAIVVVFSSIYFYKKAKELKRWHGEDEPADVDKREVLYRVKIK